jgi:hypothetical protein
MPLCETDLTPQEELNVEIRKWILQKSMSQNEEDLSTEAAPKIKAKAPSASAKPHASDPEDDLYDF